MQILLAAWIFFVLVCSVILFLDLRQNNKNISSFMKVVWILTVFYSGPLALAIYWYSGRIQLPKDTLWRRAWRSNSHCFSGCGGGEIIGVIIASTVFSLGNVGISIITFVMAYFFGYMLTFGPLLNDGMTITEALKDAFYSETASITVMEITAIIIDLTLSVKTYILHPVFWLALVVSLSTGYLAAYPINLLLVWRGIKEGMNDPTK